MSYDKAMEVKKMTSIMDKMQKETENTEIESISNYGFLFTINVAGDIQSVEFDEDTDTMELTVEHGKELAKDIEKTLKKITSAIKDKRLDITAKYKKQIDSQKKGFRGY